MSLLHEWYGKAPLTRELHVELNKLNNLLTESYNEEEILKNPQNRLKEVKKIFKIRTNEEKKELNIQHSITKTLKEYFSGKKYTKHPDKIIALAQLQRDCQTDMLWIDLKNLFWKEKKLLNRTPLNKQQLKQVLEKERKIEEKLQTIIKAELNEAHIHLCASADAQYHWKYLKIHWKRALQGKVAKEENIIKKYENAVNNNHLFAEDLKQLKRIMTAYFSGKINEHKALFEFDKLLYIQPKQQGTFNTFIKKSNLLVLLLFVLKKDEVEKTYYHLLKGIIKHNLTHNIKHIEIRVGATTKNEFNALYNIARRGEQEYPGITIRYIFTVFVKNKKELDEKMHIFKNRSQRKKKYFVAVDDISFQLHKNNIKVSLPLITHAGEFFSTKDANYNGLTNKKEKNIEIALQQIQNCLSQKNLARIGHANILGTNIAKHLRGHPKTTIKKLVNWQEKMLKEIKRRDIIIETNPTSNLMIRGLKTYKEHPISEFSKRNIKFSISTDDRINFDTNLRKEFYRISQAMKWGQKDLQHAIEMTQKTKLV